MMSHLLSMSFTNSYTIEVYCNSAVHIYKGPQLATNHMNIVPEKTHRRSHENGASFLLTFTRPLHRNSVSQKIDTLRKTCPASYLIWPQWTSNRCGKRMCDIAWSSMRTWMDKLMMTAVEWLHKPSMGVSKVDIRIFCTIGRENRVVIS